MTRRDHEGGRERRPTRRLRVDRQHRRVGAAYAARAGLEAVIVVAGRRARRARSSCRCGRSAGASSRSTAPSRTRTRTPRELASRRRARARQLARTRPHRGTEDRGIRDRRAARRRCPTCSRSRTAAAATRRRTRAASEGPARCRGCIPVEAAQRANTVASAIRIVDPMHRAEVEERSSVGRLGRHGRRRRDPPRLARARPRGRRLLRARVGRRASPGSSARLGRRAASASSASSPATGSRTRRTVERLAMSDPRARAGDDRELGPGFDVAGASRSSSGTSSRWRRRTATLDETHLGVRAFARYASPADWSFTFTDRIPRERGLGSSAAVVALGLVAGAIAAGVDPSADELLAAGHRARGPRRQPRGRARGRRLPHLGRPDRAHRRRRARRGRSPSSRRRASTRRRRARRCRKRCRTPTPSFTAGRAALLGAALARGDARPLLRGADDRLHEPYRADTRRTSPRSAATCRPARSARRSPAPARR